MEMTKQRKTLIAVAVVGLGAVALDRFVLGPPESASASTAAQESPAAEDPSMISDEPEAATVPEAGAGLPSFETLTERLARQAVTPTDQTRPDPFSLPEGWGQRVTTPVPDRPVESAASDIMLLQQYKLDGTFRSADENNQVVIFAVISGGDYSRKAMQVGAEIKVRLTNGAQSLETSQPVEVYQLIEVGNRAVVWQSQDDSTRRVVMSVAKVD